jgi:hypothetical protein
MAEWAHMTQHHGLLDNLLHNLKSELYNNKGSVLCVFDLDSTLFDVSPRIQRILEDLRELPEIKKSYPEIIPYLKDVKTQRTDWGIKAALFRAFEKASPPPQNFQREARAFWAKHFFSNEYLHFDKPVEGAIDFVNSLFAMGAEIAYLTGRDWQRMGPGTVEVLKKWNFPVPEKDNPKATVRLVMKPIQGSDDTIYKSGWFEKLKPHSYAKILFFENEPKILHSIRENHPEVDIFFMETTHSGSAEPDLAWNKLPNFLRG